LRMLHVQPCDQINTKIERLQGIPPVKAALPNEACC